MRITDLPTEILIKIVKCLDLQDVITLREVPKLRDLVLQISNEVNGHISGDEQGELFFLQIGWYTFVECIPLAKLLQQRDKRKFITVMSGNVGRRMHDIFTHFNYNTATAAIVNFLVDVGLERNVIDIRYMNHELKKYKNWQVNFAHHKVFAVIGDIEPLDLILPVVEKLVISEAGDDQREGRLRYPKLEILIFSTSIEDTIPKGESALINHKLDFTSYPTKKFALTPPRLGFKHRYWDLSNLEFCVQDECLLASIGSVSNLYFPNLKKLSLSLNFRDTKDNFKDPVIENIRAPKLETLRVEFHFGLFPIVKDLEIPESCAVILSDSLFTPSGTAWETVQPLDHHSIDLSFANRTKELHLENVKTLIGLVPAHIECLKINGIPEENALSFQGVQQPLLKLKQLMLFGSGKPIKITLLGSTKPFKANLFPAPNLEELKIHGVEKHEKILRVINTNYPKLTKLNVDISTFEKKSSKDKVTFACLEELVLWTTCSGIINLTSFLSRFDFPRLASLKICLQKIRSGKDLISICFKSLPSLKHLNFGREWPKNAKLEIKSVSSLRILKLPNSIESIDVDETPDIEMVAIQHEELPLKSKTITTHINANLKAFQVNPKRRKLNVGHIKPMSPSEPDFGWSWSA